MDLQICRCQQHISAVQPHPLTLLPRSINRPSRHLYTIASAASASTAAAGAAQQAPPPPPPQQQQKRQPLPQQQQQQPQNQQQQQRRRYRDGPLPPPLYKKPFLVRVAGRTSSIQGAAGAVVKRLQTDDLIRVAAIDPPSIPKAVLVMTAANNMLAGSSGQMLVFHPSVQSTDAEAPKVPQGSLVLHTSQILQGEVLANNFLSVNARTEQGKLSKAIAFRMRQQAHTVLECYGSAAVTTAMQALAQARSELARTNQDLACLIASGRKPDESSDSSSSSSAAEGQAAAAAAGDAAAAGGVQQQQQQQQSRYPATCHRLMVLECKRNKPRALLVRASMGMTDRTPYPGNTMQQQQGQQQPPLEQQQQ